MSSLFPQGRCVTRAYSLPTHKLSQPVRLAHLSDLHSTSLEKLPALLAAAKPDFLVMTGDMVDDRYPREAIAALLAAVGRAYPCYYVTGNHECGRGKAGEIREMFRQAGVTVLQGQQAVLQVKGQTLHLYGIDDPQGGEEAFARQLGAVCQTTDPDVYSILLSHRPEQVQAYQNFPGDLVLCGHAHGGQWRIPGLVNGLFAPNQGLFPAYAGGFYALKGPKMVVSRGLSGKTIPIPRFFNPPELVIIDLPPQ